MKKIFAFLLAFNIALSCCIVSYADDTNADLCDNLPCKSAILMEQESGEILLQKNIDEKSAPASLTKIMTMLLVIEAIENGEANLEDKISISADAKIMGGSEIWLEVGEEMSLHDILKAIAVASANDGAVAVAEHLAGNEAAFVKKMNERAAQLGMNGTHYINCHGLDEDGHYTTARDVAIVSRELMKHPQILEYSTIWIDSLRNGKTQLVNTNRLIRFYKGATGLKTGTTDNAGHCLSATATRGNLSLVAVTMGGKTGKERFASTEELLNFGFATYDNIQIPETNSLIRCVEVIGGKEAEIKAISTAPKYLLLKKKDKNAIKTTINIAEKVTAPVDKGQKLGTVSVYIEDKKISEYPIIATEQIEARNIFSTANQLWNEFCRFD
ncbi:MAG: D-alanyl-D-alanine carboxypeptidase family protein [Oscillospiraceae bacterium]